MSQQASPFSRKQLTALLNVSGIPFLQQEDGSVLVQFCNHGIPHELHIVVLPEHGFCAIHQHNIVVCSPEHASKDRIAELYRFAMLLNGMVIFGGFMTRGPQGSILSYGVAIPTSDVLLAPAQLQQAIAVLCGTIDDTYPFLQQVLWGGVSAEEALERFHRYVRGDGADGRDGNASDDGPNALAFDNDVSERMPSARKQMSDAEIDRIDDAFLSSYDRADPFSAAVAEAIVHRREASGVDGFPTDPGS
ncbi:MAG: hypothetical protein ACR2PL_12500 [Dehalococcoidia bacterium]